MQRLKDYLEKNGMTQAEFGRNIDTSRHQVSRWVNGLAKPRYAETMDRIESFTGGAIRRGDWGKK